MTCFISDVPWRQPGRHDSVPFIARSDYKPPLFCSNPHVQTIIPTVFRKVPGVTYQRERIGTPDGDFLDLDWSRVGARRLAIVFHGLEGDSGRSYMRGMVRMLNRSKWDAVAVNFRGCSGEPNRKLRMYHSGETEDLGTVISHASGSEAYAELALVGFSLGGNAILKYLGEHAEQTPSLIKAAVAISVPCDLKGCSVCLGEPMNRPYRKRFLRLLHPKITAKAQLMPDKISDRDYHRIQTLKEFDDRYTAPIHGFENADDYYERSSCRQFLSAISIPTLLVNAADDPFLSASCYPIEESQTSPHVYLEIPRHGGHVGFMSRNRNGEYWSETRTAHFLKLFVSDS